MLNEMSYPKLIMCSFGFGLILVLLCLLLPSCSDEVRLNPDSGDTCMATLCLNVSSFSSRGTDGFSRSVVSGNSDEEHVKDLWVFQFSANDGTLKKNPVYISEEKLNGNIDEIAIDFRQNSGDSSVVCVVANTHDDNWAVDDNGNVLYGFNSYTQFREQALPIAVSEPFLSSNMGATGGYTIPMYGESAEIVIATKSYIRVPLVRMFAKVGVSVDPSYPEDVNMSIKSISYCNIPYYCRVKEVTENSEYPADVAWKTKEFTGSISEYILYLPENRQGSVTDMTDKSTADDALFPTHALAIKIVMTHKTASDTHEHVYMVYPGGDMINDFNIRRNYIYNVNIKISSNPDNNK